MMYSGNYKISSITGQKNHLLLQTQDQIFKMESGMKNYLFIPDWKKSVFLELKDTTLCFIIRGHQL